MTLEDASVLAEKIASRLFHAPDGRAGCVLALKVPTEDPNIWKEVPMVWSYVVDQIRLVLEAGNGQEDGSA